MEKEYEIWPKRSSPFIGTYEILERVGPVAYKLTLPPELDKIHNVFHVSMLKSYQFYPSCLLPVESIDINPYRTYNEAPILIQAQEAKHVRNKRIPEKKFLWPRLDFGGPSNKERFDYSMVGSDNKTPQQK